MPREPASSSSSVAAAAAAGDRAAFSALMREHKDAVHRLIRRYVRDEAEAYDILQETFVSAWRGISRLDPERPVLTWLRAIALNRVRDNARRRKVRQALTIPFSAHHDAADPAPDSETASIARESLHRLQYEISRLPGGLRDPLVLTSLEGLTLKEAAETLGLTAKAVEVRVYRARTELKRRLAPEAIANMLATESST
jgi:RNA polymerase sigma factor CnrH